MHSPKRCPSPLEPPQILQGTISHRARPRRNPFQTLPARIPRRSPKSPPRRWEEVKKLHRTPKLKQLTTPKASPSTKIARNLSLPSFPNCRFKVLKRTRKTDKEQVNQASTKYITRDAKQKMQRAMCLPSIRKLPRITTSRPI